MAATYTPLASPGMARICFTGIYNDLAAASTFDGENGAEAIRALAHSSRVSSETECDSWYQVRIAGRDAGENELSARLNENRWQMVP